VSRKIIMRVASDIGRFDGRVMLIAYVLVIFLLTSDGLFIALDDVRVNFGKGMSVILAFWLVLKSLYKGTLNTGGVAGLFLAMWLILSLLVSIYHTENAGVLKHWINIVSGVAWFYVMANTDIDWHFIQRAITRYSIMLGVLSITVLVLGILLPSNLGWLDMFFQQEANSKRLVMFSWEPNIFGATISIALLMLLPMLSQTKHANYFVVFVLLLVALAASISKGPILMFAVGMFVYSISTKEKRITRLFSLLSISAICILFAIGISRPLFFKTELIRENNIGVRWTQIEYAFHDIADAPWLGSGAFSFGSMWPDLNLLFGSNESGSAWIGQAPIGILHDTGIVGLVFMLLFWSVLMLRALRSIMWLRSMNIKSNFLLFVCALFASAAALLIQDWITTLYSLPLYWAVMGLIACIPRWATEYAAKYSDISNRFVNVEVPR
jgi:hypothetical protein